MVYFFAALIKQNLHEMRKVYSECFVFCGVFCENTREMRKVYSRPCDHMEGSTEPQYALWQLLSAIVLKRANSSPLSSQLFVTI